MRIERKGDHSAPPPDWNPIFRPLRTDDLLEVLQPLAGHAYISVAYAPRPPGQKGTSAIELYFDLTGGDMSEDKQLYWQQLPGTNGDIHIFSSKHRSQIGNYRDVIEQLAQRLAGHRGEHP